MSESVKYDEKRYDRMKRWQQKKGQVDDFEAGYQKYFDCIADEVASQIAETIDDAVPDGVEVIVKISDGQCDVRLIYHERPKYGNIGVGLGSCSIFRET